jgi:hypothetical protein
MLLEATNLGIELEKAVRANIDLINHCAHESPANKWQQTRNLYNSLEDIEDPIVKAIIALRVAGQSFEAFADLESILSKNSEFFRERKKVYGVRQYTAEKKEFVNASIATETEQILFDLQARNWKDKRGRIANKITYLQQLKKLSESSINLKDLKIEGSHQEEESKQGEKIRAMIEQAKIVLADSQPTEGV